MQMEVSAGGGKKRSLNILVVIAAGLYKRILERVRPSKAAVRRRSKRFLFYDTPEIAGSIVDFFRFKIDLQFVVCQNRSPQ